MHGAARRAVGRAGLRLACPQLGDVSAAGHGAVPETGRGREPGGVRGRNAGGGESLVHEQRPGLAVADDVGDLRGGEVPVDRREVPARLQRGEIELQRGYPVGQDRGDAIAGPQAAGAQPAGELVDPGQQLARGVAGAVCLDHRRPAGALLRPAPEPERSHGPPPSARRGRPAAQGQAKRAAAGHQSGPAAGYSAPPGPASRPAPAGAGRATWRVPPGRLPSRHPTARGRSASMAHPAASRACCPSPAGSTR